ncbi:peptide chain release factor 1 [Fusobacterium equinum]|uniref:Peptide chain release factor 1 n=1 Tax=Fusobacterium equinum TaxID=134605 RepID=A0A133NB31_9FUSO|nr:MULTISPECIES: peptide chain release factor 1 [Fusobacterium]KXA13504.1 peptide chain release factor 1 [Fusobacterium equinum]
MFDKLEEVVARYEELHTLLSSPEVLNDPKKMIECNKNLNALTPLIEKYKEYKAVKEDVEFIKESLKTEKDEDMRSMMQEELKENEEQMPELEKELKILLLPKDPNDDNNVIVEIRGGAGGDEAAIFAGDLFRMYCRYAERKKWKIEIIEKQDLEGLDGLKEVAFSIQGFGAYSKLKFESGVHRVQRVPKTESAGRIHTSTATVAVLPEVEDITEVHIDPKDLKIDTYRSGGAGGQHVNMTDSAVRITHLPTGVIVQCQDERSQLKNREKAMKHLASKLLEMEVEKQRSEIEGERRLQVGTGDRAEKIRTYNFPQGRITDHRIKLTVHQLEAFLDGDLDEMIDALITFSQAEMLSASGEE